MRARTDRLASTFTVFFGRQNGLVTGLASVAPSISQKRRNVQIAANCQGAGIAEAPVIPPTLPPGPETAFGQHAAHSRRSLEDTSRPHPVTHKAAVRTFTTGKRDVCQHSDR